MKLIKDIRKYIILSGVFFLLIISLFAILTALIHKPGVQQYLLRKVCIGYGLETKTGEMELDIFGACGVVINDVETCLKEKSCSVSASSITINFSKIRLLTGKLIPVSVDIKHPVIKISSEDIISLFSKKDGGSRRMPIICRDGVNRFNIKDGEILITGPSDIVVKNLSLILDHLGDTSNTFSISGSGKAAHKGEQSEFNIKSTIDINPDDILKSIFSASLRTKDTPLAWIPEYPDKIDIKKGLFNGDLNITGSPDMGIYLGGSLNFKSVLLTLTNKKRSKRFDIPELDCNLDASIKDRVIDIDSLNLKTPDLNIDLDMIFDLTGLDNPYIRLEAKSGFMSVKTFRDNFPFQITRPWLKDTLFPMFEEGMVRMDKLLLDGTFEQFRHLREKENHSAIGMALTCKSFTVSNMGIQVPFTGVSASVDISDGNLRISGLNGEFGDSVINEASLDVEGMAAGNPRYTVFVDGDFDIRELMSHREINVVTETARQKIETFRELDGRLSARTTIGYHRDWGAPRILSGDFSFRDTLYHKRPLDLPLIFTKIDFHFPEDSENTFSGQGVFGDSPFGITGIPEISGNDPLFKHVEITADADMNQLAQRCFNTGKFPFKFKDTLPIDITIDKLEEAYTYTGTIDTEKLVMESDGFIFDAAGKGNSVSLDITHNSNGNLDLNSIRVRIGSSNILLSGEYSLVMKKLYALSIVSEDLSLGDLHVQFKDNASVLLGMLKGSLDLDFPGKGVAGIQINGNISGSNISFIPGLLPLPVSKGSFRLDLSGEKGFVNQLDMKFGKHPLNMKGILHGWDTVKGDLLITTDYIDLTEIILNNRKEEASITASSGKLKDRISDINLKVNASKGIWRNLKFNRLNAELDFSDKRIAIKNAQAELDAGDVSASGIIGRKGSGIIDISSTINLVDQPVDKLISDTGFGDRGIKGTLSLKSSLDIKGKKDEGVLKNLSGKIDSLHVTRGLIKNSKVFLKILDGLNIPDKFRERPPDMRDEGFYFHSIEGNALIEKGILKTDEFIIKSPVFNAVGSGEENLYEQTHNIRLLVQPLTNIDYIIHKIPVVGPIISGKNETIFTVGYDVEGTWDKPALDYVAVENLKGLGNVLKRAILTPVRIIENISNAAKGMKKTGPEVIDGAEPEETGTPAEKETP